MKCIFLCGMGQRAESWKAAAEHVPCQCFFPEIWENAGIPAVYDKIYSAFCRYAESFDEELIMCGLSLGGIIAMQYCIENPCKVKGLVLAGVQHTMPKALLAFQNAVFSVLPQKAFDGTGFKKADFISLTKSMRDLTFKKELSKINCPALVLSGERDRANIKACKETAELIKGAEFRVIEGAGHEINTQSPQKTGEALKDFVLRIV